MKGSQEEKLSLTWPSFDILLDGQPRFGLELLLSISQPQLTSRFLVLLSCPKS
jgi:hypothetical protein